MKTNLIAGAVLAAGGILMAGTSTAAPGGPETAAGYTTIMNYQLQSANPTDAAIGYLLHHQGSAGTSCFGQPQAECLGYAQIDAPEGARLELLEVWGFDESPDADLHFAVIANCEPPAGIATSTILKEGTFVQSGGNFFAAESLEDVTVNNADCGYTIRLRFTDPGEDPVGLAIRVRKMAMRWHRQVSPPPAAATFGDVPTTHPFFQFVEALFRSGITAGCNAAPPLYCPDQPLTRGQMAAFLAKGLGLQWPLPQSE